MQLRLCTDYAFFANLRFGLKERWVKKRLGAFRVTANQVSQRFSSRLKEERRFIRTEAFARHGWTPMRVFLTRMALVPRFFALQLLYPRAQRALGNCFALSPETASVAPCRPCSSMSG